MTKENIIRKLTSRKFIVSIISIISGVALLFGADIDTVKTVSAACMIALPSIVYCVLEGRIDEKSILCISDAMNKLEKELNKESDDEKNNESR